MRVSPTHSISCAPPAQNKTKYPIYWLRQRNTQSTLSHYHRLNQVTSLSQMKKYHPVNLALTPIPQVNPAVNLLMCPSLQIQMNQVSQITQLIRPRRKTKIHKSQSAKSTNGVAVPTMISVNSVIPLAVGTGYHVENVGLKMIADITIHLSAQIVLRNSSVLMSHVPTSTSPKL